MSSPFILFLLYRSHFCRLIFIAPFISFPIMSPVEITLPWLADTVMDSGWRPWLLHHLCNLDLCRPDLYRRPFMSSSFILPHIYRSYVYLPHLYHPIYVIPIYVVPVYIFSALRRRTYYCDWLARLWTLMWSKTSPPFMYSQIYIVHHLLRPNLCVVSIYIILIYVVPIYFAPFRLMLSPFTSSRLISNLFISSHL